jgi:hypothetical protein
MYFVAQVGEENRYYDELIYVIDRQCACNETLRRVRKTIVAM